MVILSLRIKTWESLEPKLMARTTNWCVQITDGNESTVFAPVLGWQVGVLDEVRSAVHPFRGSLDMNNVKGTAASIVLECGDGDDFGTPLRVLDQNDSRIFPV